VDWYASKLKTAASFATKVVASTEIRRKN
jgi:hypothetical protein